MFKSNWVFRASALFVLQYAFFFAGPVHAQSSSDLGLCPPGYSQGTVTTGSVECYRESSPKSTRAEAELNRIQRETVCNNHPNSMVTSSEIFGTSSGRFFSMITCTVTRAIPAGTTLCPAGLEEVYRAFDQLVCQNFGSTYPTALAAQNSITASISVCITAGGMSLQSEMMEETFDDLTFYTASHACGFATVTTNNVECPFGFMERRRNETSIECYDYDEPIDTLAEAQALNQANQNICTGKTANLGTVNEESMVGESSNSKFFSNVVCDVKIPSYGDFTDQSTIRACDATCTEEISQIRACLNGGVAGGPGCLESATQAIVRSCNTGTKAGGLCPLVLVPIYVPILLDDE